MQYVGDRSSRVNQIHDDPRKPVLLDNVMDGDDAGMTTKSSSVEGFPPRPAESLRAPPRQHRQAPTLP